MMHCHQAKVVIPPGVEKISLLVDASSLRELVGFDENFRQGNENTAYHEGGAGVQES